MILKAGFLGEPSLYEVTPFGAGVPADKAGDAAELESMLGLAEEADRTSDYYVNAPQELKDAFEESISDGKEMLLSLIHICGISVAVSVQIYGISAGR